MLIFLKNKDTLIVDDFKFRCCIGKNGLKTNKIEGDKCTPKGIFKLGTVYYRKDRVAKPKKLKTKIISKNIGWCNDSKNKFYNKEIKVNKNLKFEKLYRKDNKYDLLIPIKYNSINPKINKGSAIFLHLTSNYKKTQGCIAITKKDMLILLKLINKQTKIKIL